MELTRWWPLTGADALRERLLAAYAGPGRAYHDQRHLAEVLARIDDLTPAPEHVTVLRLAAWFHDAVYDGHPGVEVRSAAWAEAALAEAGVAREVRREVGRLVRLTETHRPAEDDAAGQVLSDADLAILAAPPERYREYVAGVRAEYAHVPDDAFALGRAAVLRDLLAKPTLFHTAHARRQWEERARANLHQELTALAG